MHTLTVLQGKERGQLEGGRVPWQRHWFLSSGCCSLLGREGEISWHQHCGDRLPLETQDVSSRSPQWGKAEKRPKTPAWPWNHPFNTLFPANPIGHQRSLGRVTSNGL